MRRHVETGQADDHGGYSCLLHEPVLNGLERLQSVGAEIATADRW